MHRDRSLNTPIPATDGSISPDTFALGSHVPNVQNIPGDGVPKGFKIYLDANNYFEVDAEASTNKIRVRAKYNGILLKLLETDICINNVTQRVWVLRSLATGETDSNPGDSE